MDMKPTGYGRWSLSEFLNLIELRSQTWCYVEIGKADGFRIPPSEGILFYAVLEGSAKLVGAMPRPIDLEAGDAVIVLSGKPHSIRTQGGEPGDVLEFLHNGEYADVPQHFTLGGDRPDARLLCGRLKVRWPGGDHPPALPATLNLKIDKSVVNFNELEPWTRQSGGTAILTRAAMLLFTVAFRAHPESESIFNDATLRDPIARACQLIRTHPFIEWSVELLARKVGMGRSNFATRFAAEVGRTPIDFVSEERMKMAANFLANSNLKISEISERTGYRSEAAFCRRFTTHFGMPPGRMRRELQRMQRRSALSGEQPTLQ